jgi:lysophospholipase L1-like esterase
MPAAPCLLLLAACAALAAAAPTEPLGPVPGLDDDAHPRTGLDNCRLKFTRDQAATVTFLGGSITEGGEWRTLVAKDLQRRFPGCRFTFVNAGISSIDSSGHAFRFTRDVLGHGTPDLLFVEAAVNDLHNARQPLEQRLAMEGILRQARRANPLMDVVCLHFADQPHLKDYAAGRVPVIIANHEAVAEHYGAPSIDLAHEVQQRIAAGQIEWARDIKDVHPSPFGHRLYAAAVARLLDRLWAAPAPAAAVAHPLPEPLDPRCYDGGRLVSITQATDLKDFAIVEKWRPRDGRGTRGGFVDVPALVGEQPGASFSFSFEGRAVGLWITAGPDSGIIESRVDGGDWQRRDTFTPWSGGLHLPWVLVLRNDLPPGPHRLELRLTAEKHPGATGTALRVQQLLVNGPTP